MSEKWTALVRQQTIGGQSAAAFCRERGISVTHFFEWRMKLSQVDATGARLVRVQLVPEKSRALEVRLAGGRSVMVEAVFDAAHLRTVLAVLEECP